MSLSWLGNEFQVSIAITENDCLLKVLFLNGTMKSPREVLLVGRILWSRWFMRKLSGGGALLWMILWIRQMFLYLMVSSQLRSLRLCRMVQ